MDTTKNISMFRYGIYLIAAVLLLGGLTLILSSCDKDPLPAGEPVTLNVSINFSNLIAGEEITRAATQSETVIVPLNNGLFMEATLEPDMDLPSTRAAYDDIKFPFDVCVAAYNSTTNAHVNHVILPASAISASGGLVSGNLTLATGASYHIIAFAYNNVISPPNLNTLAIGGSIQGIDPSKADFLYGRVDNFPVTTNNEKVQITMKHLFSRVTKVIATSLAGTGVTLTGISGVSINTETADLRMFSGHLNSTQFGSIVSYPVPDTWAPVVPATTPPSLFVDNLTNGLGGALLVYPGDGLEVSVGSTTLTPLGTITGLKTTFTKPLVSGVSYTLKVTINKLPEPPEGAGTLLPNPYIGAFWRANEIGERIIRIPVAGANAGLWAARVTWVDARWSYAGGDYILLDTLNTSNTSLNGRTQILSSGGALDPNAENHTLSALTGDTAIIGNAAAYGTGEIRFRIGLQKPFAAYDDNPDYTTTYSARYARVTIYYGAGLQKTMNLFLRQGEGADYVMHYNDAINSGGMNRPATSGPKSPSSARPAAARFSPHNLTDPAGNTVVDYTAITPLGPGGGGFVSYPTQAGYFFQWNVSTKAFPPHDTSNIGNWTNVDVELWNAAVDETCPTNYRRPNDWDGTSTGHVTNSPVHPVTGSEMRQSLWLNPQNDTGVNNVDNAVWGYYADGFFDRREIVAGPTGIALTAVSSNNNQVAYRGMLFYNSDKSSGHYNASVFFPAAGFRAFSNGGLLSTGSAGYYWSSSSVSGQNAWRIYIDSSTARVNNSLRSYGHFIRCVKPDASLDININVNDYDPDTGSGEGWLFY